MASSNASARSLRQEQLYAELVGRAALDRQLVPIDRETARSGCVCGASRRFSKPGSHHGVLCPLYIEAVV